ncbi:glycoside hydrolase [Lasiosphaeria hispida]|uniref:Probable beta-glucosidase btgE n=1 Tax=Lasiosphaeria hispida TaxID=260671 RepID=A0AAJ0HU57_9PEZI|nr:glycoside hydrolase [Lasiosphaeria hispida]
MKAAVAAAAAVLAGGVSASNHRHAHQALFEKRGHNASEVCVPGCTTIWKTITGEAGLWTPPPPPPATATAWPTGPAVVPTPIPQVCPTPGTYTFPATTIVVTETTTVCAASTTVVPSGTWTLGGVTTVVETATTVVCPYATTKTENGVVTSVLETTTYVCPSAGTYTIAPHTTTVTAATETVVVPVVSTYCPGTWTAPAVVTVVETATVIYCPFASSEVPVPATTWAPAPAPVPAAPTWEAPPKPAPTEDSKPKPTPPTSTPQLGGAGGKWAMTYTPYAHDSQCKSAEEVLSDVKKIAAAGFTTLRVYSTDCGTLPKVGAAARECGLSLIIGVFIGEVGCDNGSPDVAQQVGAIKAWAQWDLVKLVVVANEAIFNGFCSVSQLRDLIVHVKSELGGAGYGGPYTTTDVVSAWVGNDVSSICSVIDVVATNAHAYFNAGTAPSEAGKFVAGQLAIVEKVCNLPGYIMETGWPTAGNCNGAACPGVSEQATAISSIKAELGDKVVFFSYTDDPWKKPGSCNCEQHWGCGQLFSA